MHSTISTPERKKTSWKQVTLLVSTLIAVTICAMLDSPWAVPVVILVTIALGAVGMSNKDEGYDAFIWSPWTYKTLEGGDSVTSRDR